MAPDRYQWGEHTCLLQMCSGTKDRTLDDGVPCGEVMEASHCLQAIPFPFAAHVDRLRNSDCTRSKDRVSTKRYVLGGPGHEALVVSRCASELTSLHTSHTLGISSLCRQHLHVWLYMPVCTAAGI